MSRLRRRRITRTKPAQPARRPACLHPVRDVLVSAKAETTAGGKMREQPHYRADIFPESSWVDRLSVMLSPDGYVSFRAEYKGVTAHPSWADVQAIYSPRDVHRLFRSLAHAIAPMRIERRRAKAKGRRT